MNLDKEGWDEYQAEGDFCGSDGQEMLIECDVLTDKGLFCTIPGKMGP